MKETIDKLKDIYEAFELKAAKYRSNAACRRGCAFCCTEAGSIDITTLEGMQISYFIEALSRPRQKTIKKMLAQDIKKRESGKVCPCPFLLKNNACMIYDFRPFACRRIYSLHICSRDNPPMLSRRVMDTAQKTLNALQVLDETGYSGHISFILLMLDTPQFRKTYLAGEFKPEEIMAFGKTHRISINKMII